MTDTATAGTDATGADAASAGPAHPLDPATAAEFLAGRQIMADGRAAAGVGPVRLLRARRARQGRGAGLARGPGQHAGHDAGPAAARVPARRRVWRVRRRGRLADPRRGGQPPGARPPDRRPAADHHRGLRRRRGDREGRSAVAGGDGQARPDRRHQDPHLPAHGRVVRRRGGPPDGAGARVRPGRSARLRLVTSGGRRRRLPRPGGAAGLQGRRRARAAGAGRVRRLRRPGRARAAAYRACGRSRSPSPRAPASRSTAPA